jgi:hypothetical protein
LFELQYCSLVKVCRFILRTSPISEYARSAALVLLPLSSGYSYTLPLSVQVHEDLLTEIFPQAKKRRPSHSGFDTTLGQLLRGSQQIKAPMPPCMKMISPLYVAPASSLNSEMILHVQQCIFRKQHE